MVMKTMTGVWRIRRFSMRQRLLLDTLGVVDDDDDAIHSGECAVGVFGEVLVTWGIGDQ